MAKMLLMLALPAVMLAATVHTVEKRGVLLTGIELWKNTNGVVEIPYVYDRANPITDQMKSKNINLAIDEFDKRTCVQFMPKQRHHDHYLTITSEGNKCAADQGLQSHDETQKLYLQKKGCMSKSTIQHEMMHVLGFSHEQLRNDRYKRIKMNLHNIKKEGSRWWQTASERIAEAPTFWGKERTDGYPYDIHSILHYAPWQFAIDPNVGTFNAVGDKKLDRQIGYGDEMSLQDIDYINYVYNCKLNKFGERLTVQGPSGKFGPDPRDRVWQDKDSGSSGSSGSSSGSGTRPRPPVSGSKSCSRFTECQQYCRDTLKDLLTATDCVGGKCECSSKYETNEGTADTGTPYCVSNRQCETECQQSGNRVGLCKTRSCVCGN